MGRGWRDRMRVENRMQRRPCWVEISTHAFKENYRTLAEAVGVRGLAEGAPGVALLAIVKANAYGHGLAICARAAVEAGARWLGVTSVEEGVAARAVVGDGVEILVISGIFAGQGRAAVGLRLTCVVWEPWQLYELQGAAMDLEVASVPVHLELDTGMSRQGVSAAALDGVLDRLQASSGLRLDGLLTHLYAADESDGERTRVQLKELEGMVERVCSRGFKPTWLHVGNSAAVMAGEVLLELRAIGGRWGLRAMSRPGLALYGLGPEFEPEEPVAVAELRGELRQVLAWKTRVVGLRSISAGESVGYNGTFVASEPMRLALLAVGYADGLRRELSNQGEVLVRGCRVPIVGRISMDQTVVDVTELDSVAVDDEVVLLGRQGNEVITAEDHARWAGTIAWEIFTSIAERVERRVV